MEIISKTYLSLSKSVCQNCGVINSADGTGSYGFGKNVYGLNSCDHNFFLDFDNTTYTPYNSKYHTTVLKKGEYCQFCKGTFARATQQQEVHDFDETVDAQLGNQRFHITATCDDCEYIKDEYTVAKSVVESYYGKVDGKTHSVVVSDLSEAGVNTSIRYGTEADECNKTSAPSYTDAGYYPVYYEITYSYEGESMTENGVSYVWLLEDNNSENTMNSTDVHVHDYRYLELINPICTELGYERWQCNGCGSLEKKNYTPATGHDYDNIVIREASCTQGGYALHMCKSCGDYYTENTSVAEHKYNTKTVPATCIMNGHNEHICEDCGYKYITDLTPIINHEYQTTVTKPDCVMRGFTTYTCVNCEDVYISDYIDATGHDWDEGNMVTHSTCDGEGVMKYTCNVCDDKMIKATSATGHLPGNAATCTEPQVCTECNAVLELPAGHDYDIKVTAPTCTTYGFTTYVCKHGDSEYITDYVDKLLHNYESAVTAPTCTEMGFSTYSCADCGDEYIDTYTDKLHHNYEKTVTEPTCLEHGFTTFVCSACEDTYKGEYEEALGHAPTEWIIDSNATIESAGSKHIECSVCGEILQIEELPQLIDKDNTDEDGKAQVGDYSIIITDENGKPVFNSEISIDINDNVSIKLPDDRLLDYAKPTAITAFYTDTQTPKGNLVISVVDIIGTNATGTTNTNGQLVVPITYEGYTDANGYAEINGYAIIVKNETGYIEKAFIRIGEKNVISVTLPGNILFDYANRISVTVMNKDDNTPVKDMNVTVTETIVETEQTETVSPKTLSGVTDANGIVVFPPLSEDVTDSEGNSDVTEKDEQDGTGTDNNEVVETKYIISVKDKKDTITDAFVTVKDGKAYITLPDTHTLTTSNQTTVTVKNEDGEAVKGVSVTVTDKNNKSKTGITNSKGQVTLPVKTSGGGGSSSGGSSGGGSSIVNIINIKVTDKDGKTVTVSKSTDKDGNITLTLPNGTKLNNNNYYTITVTDSKGNAKSGIDVTLKDKDGNSANGITGTNGQLVLPATEHKLYVIGYNDGSFKPEGNMTRAEAAAIFARNISERKDENITNTKSKFTDINTNMWYNQYVSYLEKYKVIDGYDDGSFRPDERISRAELLSMCTRFYKLFDDMKPSKNNSFTDVTKSHWAVNYINSAIAMDWINGYADGTFKPDNKITRAEVVAIVNRVTGREADMEYVNKNIAALNPFTDLKDKSYWAYYDVIEAANTHMSIKNSDGESWVR